MVRSVSSVSFGMCLGYIFVKSLLLGEYDLMIALLLLFGSFLVYTTAIYRGK